MSSTFLFMLFNTIPTNTVFTYRTIDTNSVEIVNDIAALGTLKLCIVHKQFIGNLQPEL